jgi:hypothetical protein
LKFRAGVPILGFAQAVALSRCVFRFDTSAVGTALGAAFNGGRGAAVGAGAGLLAGSVLGAGAAQTSADDVQRRYDDAYKQCMYAAGDRVPLSGHLMTAPATGRYVPAPPPPPGSPPPPAS